MRLVRTLSIVVFIISILAMSAISTPLTPPAAMNKLELLSSAWHTYGPRGAATYSADVDGRIRNNTKCNYVKLSILVNIYDAKTGSLVKTMTSTIDKLGPGEVWKFCAAPALSVPKNDVVDKCYTYKVGVPTGTTE